jgi:hypothetical protein
VALVEVDLKMAMVQLELLIKVLLVEMVQMDQDNKVEEEVVALILMV